MSRPIEIDMSLPESTFVLRAADRGEVFVDNHGGVAISYPDLAYQDGQLVRGRYLGNGKFLKEPDEQQATDAAEARAQITGPEEGR